MSTIRKIPINSPGPGDQGRPVQEPPAPTVDPAMSARAAAEGSADFGRESKEKASGGGAGPSATDGPDGGGPATAGGPGAAGHGGAGHSRHTGKKAASQAEAPASEAAPTAVPPNVGPTVGDQAEQSIAERDALNDALLRLRAEFENYRRRSVRELAESRDRAQAELLNELLPVLDNLERALDAAEHHDESKVLGGVRMTRDMFVEQLKRAKVEEIETVGVPFDPEVHEAIVMQPSEQDEGLVAAVLQRGYRQGDRVLRPARVVVSSGPGLTGDGETKG